MFQDMGVVAGVSDAFELRRFVVGPFFTNCYAVVSDGVAMVVDPAASGARIAGALGGAHVELVVATHGHADHVGGVAALVAATGADFAMAAPDVALAGRARRDRMMGIEFDDDAPAPGRLLAEGDVVGVGKARFAVLAAPGHTPGGIVLVGEELAAGVAFMGDTLFAGSVGRTDLAGGDADQLAATLARLASEIAPETLLLCGHGEPTTMAAELATNPFLRQAGRR